MIFFFVSLVVGLLDGDGDERLALGLSFVRSSVAIHPVNTTSGSSLSFATSSATHIPKSHRITTCHDNVNIYIKKVCERCIPNMAVCHNGKVVCGRISEVCEGRA